MQSSEGVAGTNYVCRSALSLTISP
jgi:hypothetical protein